MESQKTQESENKNVDIRINNCFAEATKNDLHNLKEKWDNFVGSTDDASFKGLLSDTSIVAASPAYAIIQVTIPHKDKELMAKLEIIEKMFNDFANVNYKLVFLEDTKWNYEKNEYVKKLKGGYKYTILEEKVEKEVKQNDIDVSEVSDIFDINKIEVE